MTPTDRPTWSTSDRRLARYVAQPLSRFLAVEASGGVLLVLATAVALVWANSPWSAAYDQVWHTPVILDAGPVHLAEDLRHWVNDGLMALFFFVVGLEIKRELVTGQLADRRDAVLPAVAALGGMVVPALLFAAVNVGEPGARGWGIPMATDIAFALGVLALLGDRVPTALKALLLGLAIADDLGAIVVIALFYADDLAVSWLLAAGGGLLLVVLMRRARVWYPPAYFVVGVVVWACTLESGVHATIAGVALGLLTPARPLLGTGEADVVADRLSTDVDVTADEVRRLEFELRGSISVAERLEGALHPWTSYVVVPVFALANAGVSISADALDGALGSRVTLGVVVGLVVGKLVGVASFAWLAVRLGISRLPVGVTWRHVVGMAGLAGIGFTVSVFVAGLAYSTPALQDEAKLGVLAASTIAAAFGLLVLIGARGGDPEEMSNQRYGTSGDGYRAG
ncbi:MAG: Na+/H+ antiporter NhaA [Acidimicrobiales bacterium]